MRLWNWDLISLILISYPVIIIVTFPLGYFFIYPSQQPNAFSFLEIFISAAIILLLIILFAFVNPSFLSAKLTDKELTFNKIIKNVKIKIQDIDSAELRVIAEKKTWKKYAGGGIKLHIKTGEIVNFNAWYLIVLKIGEILNKHGIKATYELCEVSTESKWKLDCKKFDDWEVFKLEVYKRLGDGIPPGVLEEMDKVTAKEG